jgi:hypothetical protein
MARIPPSSAACRVLRIASRSRPARGSEIERLEREIKETQVVLDLI